MKRYSLRNSLLRAQTKNKNMAKRIMWFVCLLLAIGLDAKPVGEASLYVEDVKDPIALAVLDRQIDSGMYFLLLSEEDDRELVAVLQAVFTAVNDGDRSTDAILLIDFDGGAFDEEAKILNVSSCSGTLFLGLGKQENWDEMDLVRVRVKIQFK